MQRLIYLLSVLLVVSLLTFILMEKLPGDAIAASLGEFATETKIAEQRVALGLDRPVTLRYLQWLSGAVSGNLGVSSQTGQSVAALMASRLPVSIQLIAFAQLLALSLTVLITLLGTYRPAVDRLAGFVAFSLMAIPGYIVAILVIALFAVQLKILPATGYVPAELGMGAHLRSLLLPSLTLALAEMPVYLRVLRADLQTVLAKPYVRTSRSLGISPRRILFKYALKPASTTLLTVMGLSIGNMLGGAVVIETIFALPGIGRLLIDAIYARDAMLIQGVVIVIAVAYVTINFLVDMICGLLDPRTHHEIHS